MKRKIALILALVFVTLAFSACGKADAPVATPEPTLEPTPKPVASRGVFADDVYESEFLGIGFALPEGWIAMSEEELAAMAGQAEESDEIFYDFGAASAYSACMMYVVVEKSQTEITEENKDTVIAGTVETARQELATAYDNVEVTEKAVTIGGAEYPYYEIAVTMQDATFYTNMLMIVRGDYIGAVMLGGVDVSQIDSVLGQLYAIG